MISLKTLPVKALVNRIPSTHAIPVQKINRLFGSSRESSSVNREWVAYSKTYPPPSNTFPFAASFSPLNLSLCHPDRREGSVVTILSH